MTSGVTAGTASRLLEGALLVSLDVLPVFFRRAPSKSAEAGRAGVWQPLLVGGALLAGLQAWRGAASWTVALFVGRRLASRGVTAAWPSWVTLTKNATTHPWLQTAIRGGPLGPHSAKGIHICVGVALLAVGAALGIPSSKHQTTTTDASSSSPVAWTAYCRFGSVVPTNPALWWLPLVVLLGSALANGVLWLWSCYHARQSSKTQHEGVQRMVASALGHPLTLAERARLAGWAVLNAVCEEVASRGLNRYEFALLLGGRGTTAASLSWTDPSNLGQALVFGLLHYYGIPSGWTGVVLTFVYGYLMGILVDAAGGGLLYPIVAHSLADYFIFCQIARRPQKQSPKVAD
jgi:hypothetical protein